MGDLLVYLLDIQTVLAFETIRAEWTRAGAGARDPMEKKHRLARKSDLFSSRPHDWQKVRT